jgi:hypothetical protein
MVQWSTKQTNKLSGLSLRANYDRQNNNFQISRNKGISYVDCGQELLHFVDEGSYLRFGLVGNWLGDRSKI